MIKIVEKLVTNARQVGHMAISADASVRPSSSARGTFMSSTRSVIAIANTPSLNASILAVSPTAMCVSARPAAE